MNSLWLAFSKHEFLLPNFHIPGHCPGQEEGAPGSSCSTESTGGELEPHWVKGPGLAFPAIGTRLPWSGAQFPHVENEGL